LQSWRVSTTPDTETFDTWDPAASSIPAPTQQALRTLEWIGRKENVVICGPSGTGKTFFLEGLGQQAVEAGMRVAWFRLEDLDALMRAHRSDDSVPKVIARILRADLIVVDNIGLLPVGTDAAEGLYRLVDAAYEKRSITVPQTCIPPAWTNSCPKRWSRQPWTGRCTMRTSARPDGIQSVAAKPLPEKESCQ
jgi:DNA replication protein DnaC